MKKFSSNRFARPVKTNGPSTQNVNKNCDSFLQDTFSISVRKNHINFFDSQTEIQCSRDVSKFDTAL